jgi:hypothetical protein
LLLLVVLIDLVLFDFFSLYLETFFSSSLALSSPLSLQQKHLITNIAIFNGIIIRSAYDQQFLSILMLEATTFSLIPTVSAKS